MKNRKLVIWLVVVLVLPCFFVLQAHGADIEGSAAHSRIKRYEDAEIIKYQYMEYAELLVPLGKAPHSKALEGSKIVERATTRLTYRIPLGRSPFEVVKNYEVELSAGGYHKLFGGRKEEQDSSFAEAADYKEILWSPNIVALTMNGDTQVFLSMEKQDSHSRMTVNVYAVENRFWAANLSKKEGIKTGQTLLQVDISESDTIEMKMVVV